MSEAAHHSALESIAREARTTVSAVKSLYDREIEVLSREARITNFIPVLATSRVKYQLRLVKGPVPT